MMRFSIFGSGFWRKEGGKGEAGNGKRPATLPLPLATMRDSAMTLIEMIGVMAILSILATMLVPNIIEKIQDAERDREDNRLEEIAGALVKGIKARGQLPDLTVHPTNTNGWVGMAAPYATLGTNSIWKVYPGGAPGVTNSTARRVYFSAYLTNLLATTDTNFGMGWKTNVITQTITSSVLMFIVSSSKPDLQLACPTNTNVGTNEQAWLQNWIKEYDAKGNVSATNRNVIGIVEGTTNRWTNRGQFLHVKVVDMAPYLCNIQLEDWHGPLTNIIMNNLGTANLITSANCVPTTTNYLNSGITITFNPVTSNNPIWTNTIRVAPSTYSSRILTNNFTNRLTGGGPPDRIDGENVWRLSFPSLDLETSTAVELQFNLPAGPFFAIGSGSTNRVSKFVGNPNAASAGEKRYDTHNFFVLAGTPIKLFSDQETDFPPNVPNLQTVFLPKEPNHKLVYSNGIWVEQ